MKTLFLTLLFSISLLSANTDVEAFMTVNGTKKMMIKPGVPANIEVYFVDSHSREVELDYKVMHGKIMHMVIYKSDLSVFKHVHPYYDPVTGRFQVTINMPHSDPDNFHLENTITEPGMYMVMADVEIKGKGMRMAHRHLHVMGEASHNPLVKDPTNRDGSITKTFLNKYLTKMSYKITNGCGSRLIDFTLNLRGLKSKLEGIEPWLSMGGHSIIISDKMNHPESKKMSFGHMHAKMPTDMENFVFSFYDQNILTPGLNKIWFQIKHKEKVLTMPFTFVLPKADNDSSGC